MARDGRFELYHSEGYAVLTVYAPDGGKPVYPEDVLNRMRILRIPRVRADGIQKIIDAETGYPVRLVEWPAGAELSSRVTVTISDDAMSASISMRSPKKGGGIPSMSDVMDILSRSGVRYGIDHSAIESALESPQFETDLVVASGRPPVHGAPKTAEFTFEIDTGRPFLVDDTGRIDLRELNFIQEKHEGDILVRFKPPVEPVDGMDVTGDTVTANPAAPHQPVRAGANTALTEDETEIRALANGNAFFKRGAVHVEPVVVVDSVDYATGNIDYEGSVRVTRGVADGFTVSAGGCLEVGECAGRVTLRAGREMLLRGGINGGGESTVASDGDLIAKFIESSSVTCHGNLLVTDAVMHSNVIVHGNLGLRGKHAEIIGGSVLVGGNIWCRKIGSVAETPTRISVGIDPERLIEYAELHTSAEALRDRIDDLDRIRRHLESRTRTEIDENTSAKVRLEREHNQEELKQIDARLREMRNAMQASPKTRVIVEDQMYQRTTIRFGRDEFRVPSEGTDRTILKCIEGKIIESGFNAGDPPDFAALIGGA